MSSVICRVFGQLLLALAILCAPQAAFADELSKKEKSELVNRKAYSVEEWDRAERAVAENRKACRGGDAQACLEAGNAYTRGEGVGRVIEIAQILFNEACDAQLAQGCSAVGDLYASASSPNYSKAAELYERACNLGDLNACSDLATYLRSSLLGAPDPDRSRKVAQAACDAGGSEACLFVADTILASDEWSEDHGTAFAMLDTGCRQGQVNACRVLLQNLSGQAYRDEQRIAEIQHILCYLDQAADCLDIAERVYKGIGVQQNRELAMTYYDRACTIPSKFSEPNIYCDIPISLRTLPQLSAACSADNPQACADLGRALGVVSSPEADPDKAIEWLEWSCLNGIQDACADAAISIQGRYNPGDPDWSPRRMTMLEMACSAQDAQACFRLAETLLKDDWGPSNIPRAWQIFRQLCDDGNEAACGQRAQLVGIVPEEEISIAGDVFVAPIDPDDPSTIPEEIRIAQEEAKIKCVEARERFRGKTYRQTSCAPKRATIGGYRLRPGAAPWQALLWRPKRLAGQTLSEADRVLCGGSIVAKGWVLTAAHCLTDMGTSVRSGGHRIRLGVYNPRISQGISYPILRTIAHPQYNARNKYVFDIALIQYDYRAGSPGRSTQTIRSIALDPKSVGRRRIAKGMPVYSYGWGWTKTANSGSTDYLQGVKMELSSESACTALTNFKGAFLNAALCAGGQNRQQTCFGDSGGPLVYYGDAGRPTLIGVVSAGKKCGATGRPSQYTRVAKVKSWIASHVRGIR